jgi:hypothetical protein
MNEVIFIRLTTHLRFYVGTPDCQIHLKSQKKPNCHYLKLELKYPRK